MVFVWARTSRGDHFICGNFIDFSNFSTMPCTFRKKKGMVPDYRVVGSRRFLENRVVRVQIKILVGMNDELLMVASQVSLSTLAIKVSELG